MLQGIQHLSLEYDYRLRTPGWRRSDAQRGQVSFRKGFERVWQAAPCIKQTEVRCGQSGWQGSTGMLPGLQLSEAVSHFGALQNLVFADATLHFMLPAVSGVK